MTRARHALRADLEPMTQTLAGAFSDDTLISWIFDDPDTRPGHLADWMGFNIEMGLTRGHTYWSGDRQAVAIWSPPDVTLFDDLWGPRMVKILAKSIGERTSEVLAELARIGVEGKVDEPHFYLFVLGTDPGAQGQGLGADVIAPALALCDALGVAAHLESSNARNLTFYQRHGFEVTAEVQMGDTGPIIRPMRRAPR